MVHPQLSLSPNGLATSAQAISLSSALASAKGSCWDGIAKTKTQVKVKSLLSGLFVNIERE